MITVRDFQKVLVDDHITLIAGEDGLDKIIEYINVQEFSFKSSRITHHSMILTTFYGFKNIDEILEHFKWYIKIGVSAVCVHNVVYPEVPEELINLANQAGILLFYIPDKIPYYVLYEKYNHLIFQEKTKLKDEIDQFNQSMLDALLLEKNNHFIIQSIGKYLNESIIYPNKEMDIVSLWGAGFSRADLRNLLVEVIKDYRDSFTNVRITLKPDDVKLENNKHLDSILILPLNSKLDFYGYLIVGQQNKKVHFRDMIIKNAVTALILDAMKNNQTKEYHKNKDIKLLEEVFFDKRISEISVDDFYFDIRNINYLLMAEPVEKSKLKEVYQYIYQKIDEVDANGLVWIMDNKIVAMVQQEPGEDLCLLSNEKKVRIGISGKLKVLNNKELKILYEQAGISLHFNQIQGQFLSRWNELGSEKIIYFMRKSELLKDYHLDYLQPLIDYDKDNDTNLIKTLYVYLHTFFSLKESGDQLHLHPNTVKYRIKKIEDLISIKVDDPNQYLDLMMALKSYFYYLEAESLT